MPVQKLPKFELKKNPEFKIYYVNGVFGTVTPMEGRMTFYIDRLEPKFKEGGKPAEMETDRVDRELLMEIRMSPLEFKSIAEWMTNHIKRLEKDGIKFPKVKTSESYVS